MNANEIKQALYQILKESAEFFEEFTNIEHNKYDAIIRNDIKSLDEIISVEQVFYLKMRGLEQKRVNLLQTIDMKDKTLKEIIANINTNEEQDSKLKLIYDKLNKILKDFKSINSECKILIEVRLHRISIVMNKLGEVENTYTIGCNQKSNLKNHMISKKV